MIVFHGTSKQKLESIQSEGVDAPSYWGTLKEAQTYADSYGSDGVVISTDTNHYSFEANIQLAESMAENDDLDDSIDVDDLDKSLELLDSIVCTESVFVFDIC